MNDDHLKTLAQVRALLDGTQAVEFALRAKTERYDFVRRTLVRFAYHALSKPDKGLLLSFMSHVSGYSSIQMKRLTKAWLRQGKLQRRSSAGNGFTRKYTDIDRHLLAKLDELHGTLSGPATKKLCERAWLLFNLCAYQRLAGISVSHLYNLRRSTTYQRTRRQFDKTRPRAPSIGERRKPQPNGQPGYIRVDTVHQGDLDGVHTGQAQRLYAAWQGVLDQAFELNPARFTQRHPTPPALPAAAGINWPKEVPQAAAKSLRSTLNYQEPVSQTC